MKADPKKARALIGSQYHALLEMILIGESTFTPVQRPLTDKEKAYGRACIRCITPIGDGDVTLEQHTKEGKTTVYLHTSCYEMGKELYTNHPSDN